jgi:hypothetical protein
VRTPRTPVSCSSSSSGSSRIGILDVGRVGGRLKDDGVGNGKGELNAGDDMTDDDDSDAASNADIADVKTAENIRPRGCMHQVCGHLKAFTSFAAMVLFWYSIYDSVGTFPVQVLKHYVVAQQSLDFDTNPGFLRARLVELGMGAALVAISLSSLMAGKGFMYTAGDEDEDEDIDFDSASMGDTASLRNTSHDSTRSEGASLQALGRKYVKPIGAKIKGRLATTQPYERVAEKDAVAKAPREHDHDFEGNDQVVVHECAAHVDLEFSARHVEAAAKTDGPAMVLGGPLQDDDGMSLTGVEALQRNHEALCASAVFHADMPPLPHATPGDPGALPRSLAVVLENPPLHFDQHSHLPYKGSAPAVPRNISMSNLNLAGETASQPQDTRPTWFSGMMWKLRHVTMCGHKLHIDRYVYVRTACLVCCLGVNAL